MPNTMSLIATGTVTSATYSFTMSSIPQDYTDLMILISARSDNSGSSEMQFAINSVTTGYSTAMIYTNNGTSAQAASTNANPFYTWGGAVVGSGATANTFSNCSVYFPNYSSTTMHKSMSSESTAENNATAAILWLNAGINTTTAAISSLTFYCWQSFINFVPGTTFTLYGIKNS